MESKVWSGMEIIKVIRNRLRILLKVHILSLVC